MLAPIVIFAFNRPQSLARLLGDLEQCPDYARTATYIYVDGCRTAADRGAVDETLRIARSTAATVIASEGNKGLGPSIIAGVSEVIARHGSAIVLEDDLHILPGFLRFMNRALTTYQSDSRIMAVCGYGLKIRRPRGYEGDVYLSPRASSWGWGTWADRWASVDWAVSDWEQLRGDRQARRAFNRGGSDMYSMLRDYMLGRNQSWAIRFCYSQFRQGRYSVHPFLSYVDNEGFSSDATNCRQRYSRFRIAPAIPDTVEITPPNLQINKQIFRQLRWYHSIPLRIVSRLRKILNI